MSLPLNSSCPICEGHTHLYDVVDFNKSCGDPTARQNGLSGLPIFYSRCSSCQFIFAPECYAWTKEDFAQKVYNANYGLFDPDFVRIRPLANADLVERLYGNQKMTIKHLDFGGGEGLLSKTLKESGWDSNSYDPFFDDQIMPKTHSIDLVTAFEVFEHSSAIGDLCKILGRLLKEKGAILFSTLISDGKVSDQERLNWWYAAPRNGHISLFSKKSLELLAVKSNFRYVSYGENLHCFYKPSH